MPPSGTNCRRSCLSGRAAYATRRLACCSIARCCWRRVPRFRRICRAPYPGRRAGDRGSGKRRLADEYDSAIERGEIGQKPGPKIVSNPETISAKEVVPPKLIHQARVIRDAEAADPGIVRRTLNEKIDTGREPTKAALRDLGSAPKHFVFRDYGTLASYYQQKVNTRWRPTSI